MQQGNKIVVEGKGDSKGLYKHLNLQICLASKDYIKHTEMTVIGMTSLGFLASDIVL